MGYKDFDMGSVVMQSSGMDSFLSDSDDVEPVQDLRDLVSSDTGDTPRKMRVSSVDQLAGFTRVASDTLIRKSERDLWSLTQSDAGEWVIERLFDEDGNPLKV